MIGASGDPPESWRSSQNMLQIIQEDGAGGSAGNYFEDVIPGKFISLEGYAG